MSEPKRNADLTELESALASLRPAAAALDRDRLMFRSGQRSAGRSGRIWQGTAAAACLIALGLGATLLLRPTPPERVEIVYVEPQPPTASPREEPDLGPAARYFQFRDQLLSKGLDGLPAATPLAPTEPPESLDSILGIPARDRSRGGRRGS